MELVLFGLVMLLAMTMAGMIGFAANVTALPLLSMFMPIKTAVPVLIMISATQSLVQAFRVRKQTRWREVAHILLFVLIGMPVGFLMLHHLPEALMKAALGLFVAATAIKGMVDLRRGARKAFVERPYHKLLLFCSGFMTGAFGCGGPLMVIYSRNRYPDKDQFRAQQFSCGGTVMALTCLTHAASGAYTLEKLPYIVVGFIAVALALQISTRLVRYMDPLFFQKFVNVVLLLSAATLLWQVVSA